MEGKERTHAVACNLVGHDRFSLPAHGRRVSPTCLLVFRNCSCGTDRQHDARLERCSLGALSEVPAVASECC